MSIGQVIEMFTKLIPIIVEFFTNLFGNKEEGDAEANV